MCTAVQAHDHLRVGQTIERERARHRNDVPAIDQAAAIGAGGGVEMNLGGVLPQAGGQHVFGFFHRDTIDVVNLFTDLIVTPAVWFSCEGEVVVGEIETLGDAQFARNQGTRQVRHDWFWRGRVWIAFAHHHPADVFQHRLIMLVQTGGAHVDDAGFTA